LEISDLIAKYKKDPGSLDKLVKELSPEMLKLVLQYDDILRAGGEFSPEGYRSFFKVIFGSPLPDHAYYGWIIPLFYSRGEIGLEKFKGYYEGDRGKLFSFVMDKCLEYEVPKLGMVAEAFRESIKTTALTIGFTAYFIGHHPDRANLLVQVGDDTAKLNAGKIAEIIRDYPGWKAIFPTVVPDLENAWGDKGYDVKRTDVPYDKWKQSIAKRRDNTFVGLGYSSRSNIGKHPDGVLMIDDIHDENNTSSQKELQGVLTVLQGTIFFMMTKNTWVVFVGTPWVTGDVLDYVKDTGEYIFTAIPAYWEDEGITHYAWESQRGSDWVISKRKTTTSSEFARMVLLDLSKAGSGSLKYYPFASEAISFDWPMIGGADPTNVMPNAFDGKKRSYFALAYVAKIPQGGAVVVDGVLEQCSQLEAESFIAQAQTKFRNYRHTAIENVGGGALFIQVVRRNSALRIIDSDLKGFIKKGGRIRSKADRILVEMAPWFENGTVRISSADTPFLNALRRLFDKFYDLDPKSDKSFDTGDAVYHALKSMPEVLQIVSGDELPSITRRVKKDEWSMANVRY
jgi:hypothetical protein